MEKQLRSALESSPADFLSLASSLPFSNPLRSALRSILHSTTASPSLLPPSSLQSAIAAHLSSASSSAPPPSPSPRKRTRRRRAPRPAAPASPPLLALAHILRLCASHPSVSFPPSDLLPSLVLLHDSLVALGALPDLQLLVASLCEEWWRRGLPSRRALLAQSLPFLLSRSLELPRRAHVHRVYALREAFALFDFDHPSGEDLRLLIARCAITPVYLKTEEGRKFLAAVLGWGPQLAREVLEVVRSQLPFGRKSVAEAYADVLFRAWRAGSLEESFLQGLVEGAVHAGSRTLAASTRRVLAGFVEQRALEGVNKLLFRLAEPILFRSMQVANSDVRLNALHLLIDLFPLDDPELTREAKHALLEKQFFLLEKLLADDCPDVRAVGVEGVCRILSLFWEVIPSSIIVDLLTKIVNEMSHDISTEVRVSTINGVAYLLDNPQSHEVLKIFLPQLGHLFLDPALNVRVAFIDLLLVVRDIRAIQFNKVVNLNNVLSSLADDHSHVARKITQLLLPSYFPSNLSANEACNRCMSLIRSFPFAGVRLCEFAISEGAPCEVLVELLRTSVDMISLSKDLNPGQVDGLFLSCANICRGLSEEISCKMTLLEVFSKEKMKCLLKVAKSTCSQTSFLSIVSLLPPTVIGGLREHCMELIINWNGLPESEVVQQEVRMAHKLMISRGWSDSLIGVLSEVLQTVASRFQEILSHESPLISKSSSVKHKMFKVPKKIQLKLNCDTGRKSLKTGNLSIKENYALASSASWQVKELLVSMDTQDAMSKLVSDSLLHALGIISEVCITKCLNLSMLDISPVVAYMTLSLHMSLQITDNRSAPQATEEAFQAASMVSSLKHLINSIEKMFLGKEAGPSSKSSSKRKSKKLSRRLGSCSEDSARTPDIGFSHFDDLTGPSKSSNLLRLATAVLKFLSDSATSALISFDEPIWLQFSSAFAVYIKSILRDHHMQFSEEDFICFKSSFTYASKILHTFFSVVEKPEMTNLVISELANLILDLVALTESCLGSKYAARIASVTQPWLPDLVLGLCFPHLSDSDQSRSRKTCSSIPEWLVKLGEIEACEAMSKWSQDLEEYNAPDSEASVLRKIARMMVPLLRKGDARILDAMSLMFLSWLKGNLDGGDINFALGMIHFTCVKLLSGNFLEIGDLESTSICLQELFSSIENELSDGRVFDDDRRQKLECARNALNLVLSGTENDGKI